MHFRSLHDQVVVRRIDAEEKTAGGSNWQKRNCSDSTHDDLAHLRYCHGVNDAAARLR
jgi:co-chaperonin GroES (HSP10)